MSREKVRYRTFLTTRYRMVDCWMPSGIAVSGHGHPAPHLCLAAEGEFGQRLSGREHRLAPGSVRLSPPGTVHDLEVGGTDARILVVHPGARSGWDDAPDLFASADFGALPEGETLLRRLAASLAGPLPSPLQVEEIVDEIVAGVRRSRRRRPSPAPAWLLAVRERIDAAAPEIASIARLAREAGVHRVHLSRAFAEHFGCSITAYVQRRRLDRGWRLLHDPDPGIARISAEAGFTDQSHFTRVFSGALAIPPGRYRRSRSGGEPSAWQSW